MGNIYEEGKEEEKWKSNEKGGSITEKEREGNRGGEVRERRCE
jgi:hypothetical protein